MQAALKEKYENLLELLRSYGSVAVAFSGGVDSALLLYVSREALSDKVLAVTVQTPGYPAHEQKDADELLSQLQVQHLTIAVDQLSISGFAENGPERCYHCKLSLFQAVRKATAGKYAVIVDGANVDDESDYRPGMKATAELGIKSPFREVRLNKKELRQLSQEFGLFTWDKPSYACLASRIPYGDAITDKKLRMIEAAEQVLLDCGFKEMRVRCHGELARIEVGESEIEKLVQPQLRKKIVAALKEAGFMHISLDLEGFRSGNMNAVLTKKE